MAEQRGGVPAGLWERCEKCEHMVYEKEVAAALYVCPECGHHRRVDARARLSQLVDPDSFEEFAQDLRSTDPLKFKDRIPYSERLKREQEKTGDIEAIIVPWHEAMDKVDTGEIEDAKTLVALLYYDRLRRVNGLL